MRANSTFCACMSGNTSPHQRVMWSVFVTRHLGSFPGRVQHRFNMLNWPKEMLTGVWRVPAMRLIPHKLRPKTVQWLTGVFASHRFKRWQWSNDETQYRTQGIALKPVQLWQESKQVGGEGADRGNEQGGKNILMRGDGQQQRDFS